MRALWVSEHPLWRTRYFFLFLSSMHILFSQKGFAYDFEFLYAFLSKKKEKEDGGLRVQRTECVNKQNISQTRETIAVPSSAKLGSS